MRRVEWLSAENAVGRIADGAVVATSGFVGCGHPEALTRALGERFRKTRRPADLTLVYAAGQGDGNGRGLDHLAIPGLLRKVIGGHWNLAPRLGALAASGEFEAYSLPQGVVSKLFRAAAAGEPGMLSRVGLGTFIDPLHAAGRMNARSGAGMVSRVQIDGETLLLYKAPPIDTALIRASAADSFGGLSFDGEVNVGEALSIAQAARRRKGLVIAQVGRRAPDFSRDPKAVRVPGIFVDVVVEADASDQAQTFADRFCEEFIRQGPLSAVTMPPLPDGPRRWIASRALAEIPPGAIVNLGIGVPESVAQLASERQCLDRFTLTLEAGVIGGVPAGGLSFGASRFPHAIIDQPYMFDFYDGGGLDVACLSMAECDARGNVNVSRFGGRTPGPGGFINIAQSTPAVLFLGTFTAAGLEARWDGAALRIVREGEVPKFVPSVQQVTFNGPMAHGNGQRILYITERAVFQLGEAGLELTEVAPGLSASDVLERMEFAPRVSSNLTEIAARHYG